MHRAPAAMASVNAATAPCIDTASEAPTMFHAHLDSSRRPLDTLVPLLAHAERRVRLGALEELTPHINDAAVRLVLRGLAEVDPDGAVRDRSAALLRRG